MLLSERTAAGALVAGNVLGIVNGKDEGRKGKL